MKKVKVLAVSAMIMGLGSMVFANPDSMTKVATQGLIEDGVVDSLATGLEENKGFGSIQYGQNGNQAKRFNLSAGAWANEDLWTGFSLAVQNNIEETWTDRVHKTYTMADGEVVFVDTTKTDTDATSATPSLENSLSVSAYSKKLNKGAELFWDGTFDYTKINITQVSDTEPTSVNSQVVHNAGTLNYNNTFGFNFSDVKTKASEKNGLSLSLETVEFIVKGNESSTKDKFTSEEYGDAVGQGTQVLKNKSSTTTGVEDGGFVTGSLSFDLPALGSMNTKFVLVDKFGGAYNGDIGFSGKKTVTTTNTAITTETTKSSRFNTGDFYLQNVATPRLNFSFDAGDKVKVAARIDAPVDFKYTRDGVTYTKTTVKTVAENKEYSTSTTTVAKTETLVGDDKTNDNSYNVSVSPEAKVGIVWSVVPHKLNINLGVTANAGTYTCEVASSRASKKMLKNNTEVTDEFGVKTVTVDSKTAVNTAASHAEDTRTTTFTAVPALVKGSFGSTIFLGDKVSLDLLLLTGSTTGFSVGSFLTGTTASIMFNVKF